MVKRLGPLHTSPYRVVTLPQDFTEIYFESDASEFLENLEDKFFAVGGKPVY